MQKIILASSSPRRKQLLEWAEIDFDMLTAHTNEDYPDHLSLDEIPVFIARSKAEAVRNSEVYKSFQTGTPILAADTIVVLNGLVIGKPASREEAISILISLSGQTHQVITGVVLLGGKKEICFADKTEVEFHPVEIADIEYYVDQYKPYDKAGAYAIQEWIGVVGIKSINGDFYNVMGLPVSRVVEILRKKI